MDIYAEDLSHIGGGGVLILTGFTILLPLSRNKILLSGSVMSLEEGGITDDAFVSRIGVRGLFRDYLCAPWRDHNSIYSQHPELVMFLSKTS